MTPLSIKAYPNPVNDQLIINYEFADTPKEATLQLTDILGRVVHCQKMVNNQGQTHVSVTQIPKGIYFVSVQSDNQLIWQSKIVIQH